MTNTGKIELMAPAGNFESLLIQPDITHKAEAGGNLFQNKPRDHCLLLVQC